jgi:hypothetical protein
MIEDPKDVLNEYLLKALGDTPWGAFESTDSGNLNIGGIEFFMRVGLLFEKPMQAIMAMGMFVKMRNIDGYDPRELRALDPKNPLTNVYQYGQELPKQWKPFPWPPIDPKKFKIPFSEKYVMKELKRRFGKD